MSHDGSSCKSYIKHPTEKERLDNLAFTSFPEDYLPYTSSYQHGREGGKAPPYLVWDERRPRRSRKRRKGCCNTAALISAIALIVTAILAVVAISVYLGVVTNLFRSPVLSLSGKFRVSDGDEFSETLLNSSSYQFLVKAETYQAMVENVFLSSSLEPAFIAARIYAFRPSLLVFFRVYLDRRKLQLDDASVIDLVKDLVKSDSPAFGALSIDKTSVDVDENEEWLAMPGVDHRVAKVLNSTSRPAIFSATEARSSTTPAPLISQTTTTTTTNKPTSTTSKPNKPTSNVPSSNNPVPVREVSNTGTGQVISIGPLTPEEDTLRFSYGQWKPVPIEDSVSPSFGDQRTPPGRGSVRLLDEVIPPRTGRPQNPPGLSRPPSTLSRPSPSLSKPSIPASKPSPTISRPSSVLRTSGSSPLSIGVGSVSVLEDPMSHLDPVPIRNLKPQLPVIPEGHQRGEVASSIMSSVSLVVRKPNKNNPTDLPETGRLEMAKPLQMKMDSNRKDHASYRFLEDMDENMSGEKTTVDADVFDISTVESGESSGFVIEDFRYKDVNKDSELNLEKNSNLSKTLSTSFVEYVEDSKEIIDEMDVTVKDTMFGTPEKLNIMNKTNSKLEQILNETTSMNHDITDLNTQATTIEISFEGIKESTSTLSKIQSREERLQLLPIYSMRSDIGLVGLNKTVSSTKHSLETIAPPHVKLNISSENPIEPADEYTSVLAHTTSQIFEDKSTFLSSVENAKDSNELLEGKNDSKTINLNTLSSDDSTFSNFNNSNAVSTKDYTQSSANNPTHLTEVFDEHSTTTEVYHNFKTTLGSLSEIFGLNSHALENSSSDVKFDVHTMQGHGFHQPMLFSDDTILTNSEASSSSFTEDVTFPKTSKASEISSISVLASESYFEVNQSSNKSYSILFNHNTLKNEPMDSANTMESSSTVTPFPLRNDPSEDENSTLVASSQNNLVETTSFRTTMNSQNSSIPENDSNVEVKINYSNTATDVLNPANTTSSTEKISSNVSIVIQGGVPKIVPQFQDLGFNPNEIDSNDEIAIGSDDDLLGNEKLDYESTSFYNDVSNEGGIEIIRHITTIPPTPYAISLGKHPVFISSHCSEEEMQCASGECVDSDSRCNMKRDCRDNSDEKNCTCSDFLKVMGQSQKICDGVPDCKDLSDESNCPWCNKEQVICPQTKFCVNRSQICDGENDCPMGTDEKYCVKLAESVTEAHELHYRPEGYLMVRKEGEWGKLCLDSIEDSEALQMKMDELGNAVCSALTYRSVTKSIRAEDSENGKENYFVISNTMPSNSKRSSAIFEPSSCQSKSVMRVSCNSLDCGLRPMGLAIRRRIVGGQSASSGSWPWQVALYKEGDFQCGAVLVSDTWLISAGHCFYSTQSAYWTARLGLLRRGSELPSPPEQIRRIEKIILHPEYIDKGFINDIALLKMDEPVLFSDYLRPVCLPLESEDAGLWHGKQCSVVGWGKLYEIGHTFPDSLQEVRLPVISTEECRKKIIFLTMYHITDNMFCAGFDRGGRDACLGDSGGPLMCQRDDGRWLLLGVTSNGDGCGRPNRPGVYTKVTKYLSWINQTMSTQYISPTFTDICDGIRCKLGRCIPPYKICDTRWDCSEGADEDNCSD